jgi:hypothetical protein
LPIATSLKAAGLPWVPWSERGFEVDGNALDPAHPWNNERKR